MLSELLPEEKRRLHELELQLEDVAAGRRNPADVRLGLQEMSLRLDGLEKNANKENKQFRDDMRRRVQHLRLTLNHIQASLDSITRGQLKQESYLRQRNELMGRRDDVAYSTAIDIEMAESTSLRRSAQTMSDLISSGQNTLSELISQRERLKGAQRRVFDIMNYLGLSSTIMNVVERREVVDKYIVYGGMFAITILLILIWWYMT